MQIDQNGMLCVFQELYKAKNYIRMSNRCESDLEVVECKISKPKEGVGK